MSLFAATHHPRRPEAQIPHMPGFFGPLRPVQMARGHRSVCIPRWPLMYIQPPRAKLHCPRGLARYLQVRANSLQFCSRKAHKHCLVCVLHSCSKGSKRATEAGGSRAERSSCSSQTWVSMPSSRVSSESSRRFRTTACSQRILSAKQAHQVKWKPALGHRAYV